MASSSQNVAPSSSAASSSSKANGSSLSMPKDGHSVTKRLQQDLMKLMMTSNTGVSAFPDGDNLLHWIGTISGAEGTAYAGLDYKLSFSFPSRYPYSPPVVKFTTPCYHPNIDDHGNICLDILKEKWSALYDVRTILLSLQSLLGEPNNASPLNVEAADLWSDQPAFKKMVVKKYKEATAAL